MDFIISTNRKRLYYVTLFVFGLVVFWVYSENGFRDKFDELPNWEPPAPLKPHKNASGKLFDLHLKYLQSPRPCSNEIQIVIIVTSHQNNVEVRSAMRRTISQSELAALKINRFFLLGQAPDSAYMTKASLDHESKRFNDLIQGNFVEAYRNLTYKHVMGLKWVSENCRNVKYVVKMDDDIVFNVQGVVRLLSNITLPQSSIAGYVLRDMKVIREPANKWYVTQQEYQFSKYPSFVSGWFYITSPRVASKLVLLSHYFKYFWIDDVYVTGILAKSSKIRHYDLRKYFTVHSEFMQCCISDMKKHLECEILVGPNGGDNNLFFEFNQMVKLCDFGRCSKGDKPINETCVAERKINLGRGSGIIENYKLH